MAQHSIYVGFDPREAAAFAVTADSARRRANSPIPIMGIVLQDLVDRGLYRRPMEYRGNHLWDEISDAPCSTQFAISRFFTPALALEHDNAEWALFQDCDMLWRAPPERVFRLADPQYAVMCVKHAHRPTETEKMDGQVQTNYARKNWSSFCLFNLKHPSNQALDLGLLNKAPGRDLHRFCWLKDEEIGELPMEWNWLVDYSPPVDDPKCVHFTNGTPDMPGYESAPYADEWRAALTLWAAQQ